MFFAASLAYTPVMGIVVTSAQAPITAAAYDRYHVLKDGRVVAEWERVNRW